MGDLLRLIDGDVVYASKPRMTSYGLGLLKSRLNGQPLLLDIDDWETQFDQFETFSTPYIERIPRLINFNSFYYTRALESVTDLADGLTVSNSLLQQRFGGQIIRHVRDTEKFSPSRHSKVSCRKEFDIPSEDIVILFFGTPRPHKGVEKLIEAVNLIGNKRVRLLIIGGDNSDYTASLNQTTNDRVDIRGYQPFDSIPKWYAASDIACIPQQRTEASKGQIPAKLFDAMAMGVPIVTTAVSDIPEIVGDGGLVVEPSDTNELYQSLQTLVDDPDRRTELGQIARSRCIEKYSLRTVRPKIEALVESVI
ncbi:glycosyltransferase family 4 protein [Natrinema thermotolerans]|uniref:Glycosyltransferase family 4 protein n=1 Tax=Natrinema thermotolerans TaxID=121872 RepID=A0AAF0T1J3_9EURY|nr:glycosyltransferase family 4 protein [Natrinema thermotolerans]WMT07486.1 glycosyltransferase family 4 protein [Natrinema thermotolerans]WMT08118.1 glycosyltransferase family 4 protein [Natrinema thermotolerans]